MTRDVGAAFDDSHMLPLAACTVHISSVQIFKVEFQMQNAPSKKHAWPQDIPCAETLQKVLGTGNVYEHTTSESCLHPNVRADVFVKKSQARMSRGKCVMEGSTTCKGLQTERESLREFVL